ncbi:MAG TPA: NAD-binding protein [Bellilinea sp.]|nr:NAD-binding protein [Bellilinea sp.]
MNQHSRELKHRLLAELRDARVLLHESRTALLIFAFVMLIGSLALWLLYVDPLTGSRIDFGEAIFATFGLMFFESTLSFPHNIFLRILFFLIPIAGVGALADGVLRFGSALINKQNRGEKWQIAMASTLNEHVIVCGAGKIGFRVVLELRKLGREVVVIERNADGRFIDKLRSMSIPLIIADARRSETLYKANIERAAAIIPCTEDELTNLDIALDARDIKPDIKVVLRMFDPDLARRVEKGFGIHTALSTSANAAPVFAASALDLNVKSSFYAGDKLLNLSELVIQPRSLLRDWTVERLEREMDLNVVSYTDGDLVDLHPMPERVLTQGVQILVLTTLETLRQLHTMNGA